MKWRNAALIALAVSSALPVAQSENDVEPRAPCNGEEPAPTYAPIGEPPNVQVWKKPSWQAPGCLPWPRERVRLVVALAGSFRHKGDGTSLVSRFGAISSMRGIRYWSVTEAAWRVLVTDAFALEGPEQSRHRPDFKPQEMRPGVELYFAERDNRSGWVVYRMSVLEAAANRIVITTENASPVRAYGFTLFPPGTLRAAYFAQRRDSDYWAFYGLSVTGEQASGLASMSEASYINRATALYQHFTAKRAEDGEGNK
jgi:hypothetical protein